MLPDPRKLAKQGRGEDAFYISHRAIAVADGVGGWASEGVDAGEYARQLMARTGDFIDKAVADGDIPDAREAVRYAHKAVQVPGSSTACALVARPDGSVQAYNIGDSGAVILQHKRVPKEQAPLSVEEAAKLWTALGAVPIVQQGFNFPAQLAAQAKYSNRIEDGKAVAAHLGGGELVLACTDGVFDNLSVPDMVNILARFDFEPCHQLTRMRRLRYMEALATERRLASGDAGAAAHGKAISEGGTGMPLDRMGGLSSADTAVTDAQLAAKEKDCRAQLSAMATAIAMASQRVGADTKADTPFSRNAAAFGLNWKGGKLDDCTVVAALVLPDETAVADFPEMLAAPLRAGSAKSGAQGA